MPAARRWIRLDVGWEESEWIAGLPLGARLAWVLLIGHVKTRGIGGRAKAPSTSIIARKWDIPAADVEAMIRAAVDDGALEIQDGEWVLTAWARYQEPDLTAAERKRRERASRNSATNGTGHAVTTVTPRDSGVTRHATETETETETKNPPLPAEEPPPHRNGNGAASAAIEKLVAYVGEEHRPAVLDVSQLRGTNGAWASGVLALYGPGEKADKQVNAVAHDRRPRVLALALERARTDADRWHSPWFRSVFVRAADDEANPARGSPTPFQELETLVASFTAAERERWYDLRDELEAQGVEPEEAASAAAHRVRQP